MFLTSKTIKHLITEGVQVFTKDHERVTKPLIDTVDPEQMKFMEGGSYDLRIDNLYEVGFSGGCIPREKPDRITPGINLCLTDDHDYWHVSFGTYYLVQTIESLNLPPYLRAFITGRTTLFRCGLHLLCSGVHPNYQGKLTFGLTDLRGGNKIQHGARIASVVFAQIEHGESDLYRGAWQGGRMSTNGKKEKAY